MPVRTVVRKINRLFFHHILHADDSPERIAAGAAVGMLVAWTPTVGVQMVIAFTIAAMVRVNKVATIPIVWITNPITVVPIYWFNFRFGHMLLTGSWAPDPAIKLKLAEMSHLTISLGMFTKAYWTDMFDLFVSIGWPLWIGSVFSGVFLAAITYLATKWTIVNYREKKNYGEPAVGQGIATLSPTLTSVKSETKHTAA